MRQKTWSQWAQAEWAGWYLEYLVAQFCIENKTEDSIKYIRQKKEGELDFDLWFDEVQFYGDLKAESSTNSAILGNDKESVLEAINRYDRFWFVVYEHDTIEDKNRNYEVSEYINNLKLEYGKWPKGKPFDPHSYGRKLKHSVKFIKMYIVEVNRINYGDVLSDFNQGKEPDGSPRRAKVEIKKKNLDNFIIYRYDGEKDDLS